MYGTTSRPLLTVACAKPDGILAESLGLAELLGFGRISWFWQNFLVLTESLGFGRTSWFWQNLLVLAELLGFGRISWFWRNLLVLAKSVVLMVVLVLMGFFCVADVTCTVPGLGVFTCGCIHFTFHLLRSTIVLCVHTSSC